MSDPLDDTGESSSRPAGRRALNFTGLQFALFAGAALVGLAALLAGGLAIGLALAGAAMIAVVVLGLWVTAANLLDKG